MGTGRRRISLAGRGLAARVVGSRVLAPEDPVVPAVPAALVVPEDPVVPAALVVLESPAVPENQVVLVVPESPAVRALAIVLAGVQEPETALVEVEAAPERDKVAVPLRIKSVTAPHRRGLVPVPKRVEDLAAAAETTRDPAATEAATAWVAAV